MCADIPVSVLKNTGDSTKMGEDYMMGRITRDKAKAA